MPKQKKAAGSRAKPYGKSTSEQTVENGATKESGHEQAQGEMTAGNQESMICCICEEKIIEETEEQDGEEAIFCEGLCKNWIHCKCAGLSNVWFSKLSSSNKPFVCVYCTLFEQISIITELKEDVKNLKIKLDESPQVNVPSDMDIVNANPSPAPAPPDLDKIYTQLNQLSDSVQNQQKFLENREKADRMNNLVLVGLEDKGDSEDTVSAVNNFLTGNLNLTDIKITKAKRLGKFQKKPRPVLVAFNSSSNRKTVLSHRTKLAGTNIYINFDLTREQIKEQQKLREIRKQLIKHPDFKDKKITIYQNKIHVNRQPISSDILSAAGINQ